MPARYANDNTHPLDLEGTSDLHRHAVGREGMIGEDFGSAHDSRPNAVGSQEIGGRAYWLNQIALANPGDKAVKAR